MRDGIVAAIFRRLLLMPLAVLLWGTAPAQAGPEPVVGPVPAWVHEAGMPEQREQDDQAPFRILLFDQQVALEPGQPSIYSRVVMHLRTPQGLAAGNVSLIWRPETDTLIVHHVLIRRGNESIDTLAAGNKFTVARREQSLEAAVLNGILTASMQPDGLQVGDVLDIAYSLVSRDPVMRDHVEYMGPAWNKLSMRVGSGALRVEWPAAQTVKNSTMGQLPPLKVVKQSGRSSVQLAMTDVDPLPPPKDAPARFALGRLVEFSDFAHWADLSALLYPHYRDAARIPASGPLREALTRIRAQSSDPHMQAEAALALVQNDVRYFALAMGAGALVPADADTTWTRRYGDCKAKTALLLALLHEMGIDADPVLISTQFGDGLPQHLPLIALFDHVLVRAQINGRTYWMDGTQTGGLPLDQLITPVWHWGLVLAAKGGDLVPVMPEPLEVPLAVTRIEMDASAGVRIAAPTKGETTLRSVGALSVKLALDNLAGDARDQALRQYWRKEYDFIDVEQVASTFDSATGVLRLTMAGKAHMDWSNDYYITDGTKMGRKKGFTRDPGPAQEAPVVVPFPYYKRVEQMIRLPSSSGLFGLSEGINVDQTLGGIEFHRHAEIKGSVFSIVATERSLVPEISFKTAMADRDGLIALFKRTATVKMPEEYYPTGAEVDLALKETPTDSEAYQQRAMMLSERGRDKEAVADLDHAVTLDPKNGRALLARAAIRAHQGDLAGAGRDIDTAEALDPGSVSVLRARITLAGYAKRPGDAVKPLTRLIELTPKDIDLLTERAIVYDDLRQPDKAIADFKAAIERAPTDDTPYWHWALLEVGRGQPDAAAAVAEALLRANPQDNAATITAANINRLIDRRAAAMQLYDQALARGPTVDLYLERSLDRPVADRAARLADIDAALALDPQSTPALMKKAALLMEMDDADGAAAVWSALSGSTGNESFVLVKRGVAYLKAGRADLAEKDFAVALSLDDAPEVYNNICWAKATGNVALESALADCDQALALRPDAPDYLDSRALVLLRLGRLDDALADYDRVLARMPDFGTSFYARAIIWTRKGMADKAAADFRLAFRVRPRASDEFARYGVTP